MANQVTFSIEESLKKFGKRVEDLTVLMRDEFNDAVKNLSYAAYAKIQSIAQEELHSTRQDYIKGLDIKALDENSYLITLNGDWPNRIEAGWESYVMNASMLKSDKVVGIGPNAGQPWVRESKERPGSPAHKYAHVPMEQHPHSKAPEQSNMADAIRELTAINSSGLEQKLTSIFKDDAGNAAQGRVATAKSDNPLLNNLVKYQYTSTGSTGKTRTRSVYMLYRTISETGKDWTNKGHQALDAFSEAEKFIDSQMNVIVQKIIGG